jgi:hypothetical protein
MAELKVSRDSDVVVEDDYSWWEVIYWLVGIIMIPLVPILMVAFLTPFSGIGGTGR